MFQVDLEDLRTVTSDKAKVCSSLQNFKNSSRDLCPGDGRRARDPVLRDLGRHRTGRGGGGGGPALLGHGQDRAEPGGGEEESSQSGESAGAEDVHEVRRRSYSLIYPDCEKVTEEETGPRQYRQSLPGPGRWLTVKLCLLVTLCIKIFP